MRRNVLPSLLVAGLLAASGCGSEETSGEPLADGTPASASSPSPGAGARGADALHLGTVEFFKNDKGFGYIRPDDGGKDLFVQQTDFILDGLGPLQRGDRVTFVTVNDPKGPHAIQVRRVEVEG